ncbi:V-type ATP synthase subunit I [Streptococcus danieliae]|uniref:V-type ATP synthase subunit I n=1 Tax=Streptococcus danieliae TaxID=747656 RepID=A0A7X3KCA5_9STRE|nr:V-type ATP synthase subunit I [Streptococcus danieliae]MVX59350.1 V-type ATP synthase subunit I [Streptococcus danieliae]
MAISPMKKIALLFTSEQVDAVTELLQGLEIVEIQDLKAQDSWIQAFSSQQVTSPQLSVNVYSDQENSKELVGDEVLRHLENQQRHLEVLRERLRVYLPIPGVVERLRTPPQAVTATELKSLGEGERMVRLSQEIQTKLTRVKVIEDSLEDNRDLMKLLEPWRDLQFFPNNLNEFQFLQAQVGTLPRTADDQAYKVLLAAEGLQVEELFVTEKEYGLLCLSQGNPEDILKTAGFQVFDYDEPMLPGEKLHQLASENQELEAEKAALVDHLGTYQEQLGALQGQIDFLLTQKSRQVSKTLMANTTHLTGLEGWIEEERLPELQEALETEFGSTVFLTELTVADEEQAQIPIKLNNTALVEPFELLTEMYALPKYYEKDPTPILAPFYFTFFGMMVADLGYGLLITLSAFLALKLFYLPKNTIRFIKFFSILGIAVSIWGLIYGSFFGYDLPFHLISTRTDVMMILIVSVVFGLLTVISGLFLGGLQKVKMKDYSEAYHSGFAWCLILIGLAMVAVGSLAQPYAVLATIGKWLAILNALAILVVSVVQSKSLAGLGQGFFNLYNISSYVGDLVSFTRLMALGLSGASIGSAFNLIVGLFPGISKFTVGLVIFIALHAINIFLSLLSGYVHGARLMFVEFFGKFYEGGGQAFSPLKVSEKYIVLKEHQSSLGDEANKRSF